MHEPEGRVQFEVFENLQVLIYYSKLHEKNHVIYLLIIYVQKFQQTADSLFLFCLTGLTRSARKNPICPNISPVVCSFFACFCFWHYPLNFELWCCCSQQTCPPFFCFVTVFQGTCQSFLISTFCTKTKKKFNFCTVWD